MLKQLRLDYDGIVVSKKNSKVIRKNWHTGRSFITSNNISKRNEQDMILAFKQQIMGTSVAKDFAPCSIEIQITEPNLNRRDLDNQATSVLDALVRAGVLEDDSIKTVRSITVRLMGVDYEKPHTVVIITREEGEILCR